MLGPLAIAAYLAAVGLGGVRWFFILGLLGVALTVRWLPWYRHAMQEEARHRREFPGRNRIGAMVLLVSVVVLRSWCQIGVAGFLPFFYLNRHIPLAQAEWLTFLFLGAGAVGTYLGGVWSDKLGNRRMVLFSMLFAIPFAYLVPRVSGIWAVLVLLGFGFTVLSSFAVTVVYGQQLLPKSLGLASGLIIGLGVGAGGIGATLSGWLADHFGVATVLHVVPVLPLLAAAIALGLPTPERLAASSG